MPKKILLAFLLLATCLATEAQNLPSDSTLTRIFQTDALLPLLMDSAMQNSAALRRMNKSVKLYGQNLQSTKKSILNSINLNTNYGYGNVGTLGFENDPNLGQLSSFKSAKSSRYSVGVVVQVSVGTLLSRKNATRVAELQIEMAEDEMENAKISIRQQVIQLYQDLKLSHALMLSAGKSKQAAFVSLSMGQKNFMDGQISLEQFSTMQGSYNQLVMDYDSRVNKFQTSFLLLETYTGVQLTQLMNRVRM